MAGQSATCGSASNPSSDIIRIETLNGPGFGVSFIRARKHLCLNDEVVTVYQGLTVLAFADATLGSEMRVQNFP
jgi:hypothetical protein